MKRDAEHRPQANAFRPLGNSPSQRHFTPVFLLFYIFGVIRRNYYITNISFVNKVINKFFESPWWLAHKPQFIVSAQAKTSIKIQFVYPFILPFSRLFFCYQNFVHLADFKVFPKKHLTSLPQSFPHFKWG